jgi:hypothetical protein
MVLTGAFEMLGLTGTGYAVAIATSGLLLGAVLAGGVIAAKSIWSKSEANIKAVDLILSQMEKKTVDQINYIRNIWQ